MVTSDSSSYIPLSIPCLKGNERKYVDECIATNWISSAGAFVTRFEEGFARYVGAKHAVAVSSGTAALHLALISAEIKENDEVLIPSLTFIAPVNATSYIGAKPIFIDSEKENLGLDPDAVESFIKENCLYHKNQLINKKSGNRIKCILPVHLYGHACRVDELIRIADNHNLTVIEDAAEGVGCRFNQNHIGTYGKIGCFSFNGNKLLTTGGGGMIITNDKKIAKHIKHISTQAKCDELYYIHDEIGYNYRMSNIQAAIGLAQLEKLDDMIKRKITIHNKYLNELSCLEGVKIFDAPKGSQSTFWLDLLLISKNKRDDFIKHMQKNNIQTRPFWQLNHLHPMYQSSQRDNLHTAKMLHRSGVAIPCHQQMTDKEVEKVIDTIKSFPFK